VHVNVRLEEERLCLLVLIGVRADGTKELITLADGYRESAGSWADLLRDAARRGMRAPVLAVGDGALGFWAALGEVFPATRTSAAGSTGSVNQGGGVVGSWWGWTEARTSVAVAKWVLAGVGVNPCWVRIGPTSRTTPMVRRLTWNSSARVSWVHSLRW
jgi:hypothetical protein